MNKCKVGGESSLDEMIGDEDVEGGKGRSASGSGWFVSGSKTSFSGFRLSHPQEARVKSLLSQLPE